MITALNQPAQREWQSCKQCRSSQVQDEEDLLMTLWMIMLPSRNMLTTSQA